VAVLDLEAGPHRGADHDVAQIGALGRRGPQAQDVVEESGGVLLELLGCEGRLADGNVDVSPGVDPELHLAGHEFPNAGAEALVRALDAPEHLNLQYNDIGPKSAAALAAAPWGRKARLGLSHNKLFHETDTYDTYDYGMAPRELTCDELKQRYGFRNVY